MLHKQAASSRGELKMYEYGMPVLHSLMYTFELHVFSSACTAVVVTFRFPGPPVCLRPPGSPRVKNLDNNIKILGIFRIISEVKSLFPIVCIGIGYHQLKEV